MIPLFSIDEVFLVCRKMCLDTFGEHAVHCKEFFVIFYIFKQTGVPGKEAHVNFLANPLDRRSTLRPADIMVYGWVGEKHGCVDLTWVSPLVGLGVRAFTVG